MHCAPIENIKSIHFFVSFLSINFVKHFEDLRADTYTFYVIKEHQSNREKIKRLKQNKNLFNGLKFSGAFYFWNAYT